MGNQAYIFLYAVIGGMIIGFIYDLLRIKRRAIKTNVIIVNLEDFAYWIIVSLFMLLMVYYSNEGEIRGFIFIGTVMGVVLYALLLSKIVVKSSVFILKWLFKIIKFIFSILFYPLKVIIKILSIPVKFIYRKTKKAARVTKRAGQSRAQKIFVWGRIIRNFRKKI